MFKAPSIIICFFLFDCIKIFAQEPVTLTRVGDFGPNPGNLKMLVYSGKQISNKALKPLVVVLHGCGQSADEVASLTGWNKLAGLHDFLLLYPEQKFINNVNTCFNWFRNTDINKGKGECESIYQMIRYMQKNYPVDSSRIFITGLSAGAAMAVVMMATHPELFSCGSIFAGGAYKIATNAFASVSAMSGNRNPSSDELVKNVIGQNENYSGEFPSVIIYQGMNDMVVNHKNADLLLMQWAGIHHCDTVPDKTEHSFLGVNDITREEFKNSSGKTVVTYYKIRNLGHRVLVKPGEGKDEGGETGTYGANRNFHSTYQTAKEFGILRE